MVHEFMYVILGGSLDLTFEISPACDIEGMLVRLHSIFLLAQLKPCDCSNM